jgi:hypothetical protein
MKVTQVHNTTFIDKFKSIMHYFILYADTV